MPAAAELVPDLAIDGNARRIQRRNDEPQLSATNENRPHQQRRCTAPAVLGVDDDPADAAHRDRAAAPPLAEVPHPSAGDDAIPVHDDEIAPVLDRDSDRDLPLLALGGGHQPERARANLDQGVEVIRCRVAGGQGGHSADVTHPSLTSGGGERIPHDAR